jgi:hypothetical protein
MRLLSTTEHEESWEAGGPVAVTVPGGAFDTWRLVDGQTTRHLADDVGLITDNRYELTAWSVP